MSTEPRINRPLSPAAIAQQEAHAGRMMDYAVSAGDLYAAVIWRVTMRAFTDLKRSRLTGGVVRNKGAL